MLNLTVANVFAFIFRYLLPIGCFFNNYSSVPTDRYMPLDIKGFQRFHGEPDPALSTAEPGDEEDQEPNQAADPYEKIIRGPVNYLVSIPGKNIRGKLISAFNEWFHLPEDKLDIIKEIIDGLHTASLLIDDIQDGSQLRRGRPVAHNIFGVAQTINAANYAYFQQQEKLDKIDDPRAFPIFTRELLNLHRGQGMDLYWRDALVCPTEEEYIQMVIYKTGGLFRLALELMQIQSTVTTDFSRLVELLGVTFQIRDDYMNLQDGLYAEKKGLMEDLTEGKFSYPIIHSIHAAPGNTQLISILKQRSEDEAVKLYAVQYMESMGSFQYCREVLSRLMEQTRSYISELESSLGPNRGLHCILDLLHVQPPNRKPRI
ncbi:FPP/GGPP synthase family protein [Aspergillus alliaceus]|uniref:FPP/GGPP synthase family protein n=1 Tax=Petromyces alliaceus TaxID=209559 RepID=UPI0012A3FFE1|nr:terpenoid synthase [Aspergillus alliaceus]KAB8227330.1 terpenoid synthase [Aspergillus alliaceus]